MSCGYCDGSGKELVGCSGDYTYGSVRIDEPDVLRIFASGDDDAENSVHIGYCPMCGRDLREGDAE